MKPYRPFKPLGKSKTKAKAIPVRQSNVISHTYDPSAGHLTVTFRGGRKYRYEGVDQKTADGLANAKSKGTFLHVSVIGKFRHSELKD